MQPLCSEKQYAEYHVSIKRSEVSWAINHVFNDTTYFSFLLNWLKWDEKLKKSLICCTCPWHKHIMVTAIQKNDLIGVYTYIAFNIFCVFGSNGSRSRKMCGELSRMMNDFSRIFFARSISPFTQCTYLISRISSGGMN